MNAFLTSPPLADSRQRTAFAVKLLLEDTTALAVELHKDDWGVFILFTLIAIFSLVICLTHWYSTLEGIGSALGWLFLQAGVLLAKTSPITLPAYVFLRVTKKVYSYAWFFDALALFAFGVDINILWHAVKGP